MMKSLFRAYGLSNYGVASQRIVHDLFGSMNNHAPNLYEMYFQSYYSCNKRQAYSLKYIGCKL